ncbi:MAG: type VI secretion system tip protein VgrG, partial [Acidobacteriota bacterium]|nr:type VI secretion system tip protein VgrG [Acidobacteriota bacterium]
MSYTQLDRHISIHTVLGTDALLLQSVTGYEGISRPFNFDCTLLSENPAIPFEKIIGQKATIVLNVRDAEPRYINGFVSQFAQSGSDVRFTHYRAQVVPWLWFLGRTADCRIFQNMTPPDIVKKVFTDLGFQDFKDVLQGGFDPCEYCVQYRETDLNFVSRIMERYGLFYFFEHQKDKHTLVLANSPAAHQPCPGQAEARYEYDSSGVEDENAITGWNLEQTLRPGRYALADYNFETPSTSLEVNADSRNSAGRSFEIFDYPGDYAKMAAGEAIVKMRMQEEEMPGKAANGASTCRAFTPGYRFDLKEHYRPDVNTAYVLTEVRHVASVGTSYSGSGAGPDNASYSNQFAAIPHSSPYRPARITPRPLVQGPQTAVVVGKKGEEIWVDKYGRVKVQFHWDREGKLDEESSRWIRVSQTWAGKGWGSMHIPRIGQEVIVDFLEGDPDRPLVTGRVYNAEQLPPYALPAEQTKSTMKSMSSKGGGGFNELRFEDAKGKEQIFIHAEKNQDIRVKNDLYETIGQDSHLTITKDRLAKIGGDDHLQIAGDRNEKVGGTISINAGTDWQQKAGMNYALNAGM